MAAARTRLILDKPFLGALALRLPLVEAEQGWCQTTWSNGKSLYYNHSYIDSLDVAQTQFALSREAMHCALLHFYRRANRVKKLWETACNFAVNPILIDDGLKPTPDTVFLPEFSGMTAEEIYPMLQENELQQEEKPPGAGDDNSEQSESPQQQQAKLKPGEMEMLASQWQQRLAAAAQQAQQAGKLSAEMMRLVDFFLQPKLPWRSLLAQHLNATARNDYSYIRPSSRRGDPAVFPGLRSEEIDLVVAVDTSGSIREAEIEQFFSEINAIKGQIRARITLVCCDALIGDDFPVVFEAWDEFKFETQIEGGGGTDFRPVFRWIEQQDMNPDTLVYFTDACGEFPEYEPPYPALWLVKGKAKPPFGVRIQLND
ncbi:MAG: VWA-like domain-containing protein [Gammaproteobacteria bacterium]|nr:VWA-like domain-containing protein [Gammaproteobacteria bacterium]